MNYSLSGNGQLVLIDVAKLQSHQATTAKEEQSKLQSIIIRRAMLLTQCLNNGFLKQATFSYVSEPVLFQLVII